jgi:hypothetical protein
VARLGARDDFERARDVLTQLCGEDDDLDARQAEWLGRAKAFVAEPKNWHAIEVFARELLARDHIDGQHVASLLEFADGEMSEADWLRARARFD